MARPEGGIDMNLDFSFYNWDLISNFVLKGLYFSLILTLVATIGGVPVSYTHLTLPTNREV